MHLCFYHAFSWLGGSFLASVEYSIVWIWHSLFTCSLTEEHLGGFKVLVIMNKIAINIHVQVFVWA
jgi:hypothetical protein